MRATLGLCFPVRDMEISRRGSLAAVAPDYVLKYECHGIGGDECHEINITKLDRQCEVVCFSDEQAFHFTDTQGQRHCFYTEHKSCAAGWVEAIANCHELFEGQPMTSSSDQPYVNQQICLGSSSFENMTLESE